MCIFFPLKPIGFAKYMSNTQAFCFLYFFYVYQRRHQGLGQRKKTGIKHKWKHVIFKHPFYIWSAQPEGPITSLLMGILLSNTAKLMGASVSIVPIKIPIKITGVMRALILLVSAGSTILLCGTYFILICEDCFQDKFPVTTLRTDANTTNTSFTPSE